MTKYLLFRETHSGKIHIHEVIYEGSGDFTTTYRGNTKGFVTKIDPDKAKSHINKEQFYNNGYTGYNAQLLTI